MNVVHLIGGGPGAIAPLRRHFKSALAEIEAPRPLIAYVGAASGDHQGFFRMIRDGLSSDRARFRMAKLASKRASVSAARALLDDCDMIFVSGGDVSHGMRVLRDRDMVRPLRALARAGKPVFGVSAGSLMLARDWVSFPDDDTSRARLFPCLGIAPLHVDAHSEDDGWSELRVLVRLLGQRGDAPAIGYGLTRGGGLRLEIDEAGARIAPMGAPIPRFGLRREKVIALRPLRRATRAV